MSLAAQAVERQTPVAAQLLLLGFMILTVIVILPR
jgi:hypothetical protein